LPYTLNTKPTFTGILHTKETVPIKQVGATINSKFCDNVKLDGANISFTPEFDLAYGCYKVYISVVFENSHVACAWWRFEVLKEPPNISGFLGDFEGRKYYVCFSREIDKERLIDVSNWSLNGDSSLIEKVEPWHIGNWAIVQIVSEKQKAKLRDQDYYLCFDTGDGITETLLIPEEVKGDNGGPGLETGCGQIEHFPSQDVHYSFESEFHALTYKVVLQPNCELNAQWIMDSEFNFDISNSQYTPLSEATSTVLGWNLQHVDHRFPLSRGHHSLFYSPDVRSHFEVHVWDNRNPPNFIWQCLQDFPADLTAPEFTLDPIFMTGEEAAGFLEEHYWIKKQEPPGELPLYIQNMIDLLRTDDFKCRKLVLWGAEDKGPRGFHHGYMWEYGHLDWGWDENSPPYDTWIQNDQDTLGAFVVDLPPEAPLETRPWNDPPYNPLWVDGEWQGEYKVWIFDYELFINANLTDVSEHHDTFIMKPMVVDFNGNWKRAENIFVDFYDEPNNFQLNFIYPTAAGGIKSRQYINLTPGEDLPEPIPDESRGETIDVKVEIVTPPNIVIPQGSLVCFSWEDPAIDDYPSSTTNPPGNDSRPLFPWVNMSTDDRQACTDDPNKIIGYCYPDPDPEENCPLPDPTGNVNEPSYPHSDNSFPIQYGEKGFPSNLDAYCKDIHYYKPGYGVDRKHSQCVEIEPNNAENCHTIVETEFHTSNFGGDNYILRACICIPIWDSEEYEWEWIFYPWISSGTTINVWRKIWVELAFMEEADRDPNVQGEYWASWQDPNDPEQEPVKYYHFNGPFSAYCLEYIRNAFDDCFIEVGEGPGRDYDTEWVDTLGKLLLAWYAHVKTLFHIRGTPHCFQLLYVDHLIDPPEDWRFLERGVTPDPNENHHSFGASGSIKEIYKQDIDFLYIDKQETRKYYEIISNTSAHELGHALGFGSGGLICNGHVSGPGLMWAAHDFCDNAPITKSRRMSYFWGDHVFVLRAAPDI